jgi:hypothetical protein
MQLSCYECALRACGLFKPVTPEELNVINQIKRDHLLVPAGGGMQRSVPALAFDVTWLGSREESIVDGNLTSAGRRTAAERVAALIVALYKRAKALGLVARRDVRFSFDAAAHCRCVGPVAGSHQQDLGATTAAGNVQARERYVDPYQSTGSGQHRPILRTRDCAAAAHMNSIALRGQ